LRFSLLPTLYYYNARDISTGIASFLTLSAPAGGTWYLGTYGYRNDSYSFTIQATSSTACPNQCSNHGTCTAGVCVCSHATGAYCQYLDHTMYSGTYGGYVGQTYWNYFIVNMYSIQNWVITMTDTADVDIYYSLTNYPTLTNYTGYNVGTSRTSVLTLPSNGNSNIYFGVYGYAAGNYTISLSLDDSCPSGCSGRGTCNFAKCYCNPGYAGADCSLTATLLPNGVAVSSSLAQNNAWKFYYFTISSPSSFLSIDLQESSSSGFLWLYFSFSYSPSATSYYYSDQSQLANHYYHGTPSINNTYVVGVYSNNYGNAWPINYTLSAWASPF